ncbi:hypothetical protein ACWD7C_34605 [Streptomyces sp. NPDC005134]|uniref:hypothetical protein n=1 Tax=unclassified Streptomyces TaxID=2593676 RepID=UPI0033B6680B
MRPQGRAPDALQVADRGFDHEAPMSPYGNEGEPWPGVIDDVPGVFRPFVEEPAFTDKNDVPVVTACLWRGRQTVGGSTA